MDQHQFGALTKAFARRLTRREALRTGGAAVGTAAGGLAIAARTAAQEATPSPGDELADPSFLFVQVAERGTWAPKPGADDVYLVTLTGVWAQTIYFSDRPERIVGTTSTEAFLAGLGFTPANPPNAALVAQTAEGEDVVVVELLNPAYDAAAGTLVYEARVLESYSEAGLANLAAQQTDAALPESFGATSLFIDDCPNIECCCQDSHGHNVGKVSIGTCWQGIDPGCEPCHDLKNNHDCLEKFPQGCAGGCYAECYARC